MGHLNKLNKQKNILGQDGNCVSNKIGQTKMTSYLCTIITIFLGTYIGSSNGYLTYIVPRYYSRLGWYSSLMANTPFTY
jgi:hypothetical protein